MTEWFDDFPVFKADTVHQVPKGRFEAAMRSVIRETGLDDEQAMRVVEAVFGPLKLLSPPDHPVESRCPCAYFPEEGGWHYCHKDHSEPDDDPEFHHNDGDGDDYEEWDELLNVGRVFKVKMWLADPVD